MTPELQLEMDRRRGSVVGLLLEHDNAILGKGFSERLNERKESADKFMALLAEVEATAVERCAKVAEQHAQSFAWADRGCLRTNSGNVAAAIRAQKEPSA